jgi:hypothetical protein
MNSNRQRSSYMESRRTRPLLERLTPVAWATFALAILIGVGLIIAILERITAQGALPTQPPAAQASVAQTISTATAAAPAATPSADVIAAATAAAILPEQNGVNGLKRVNDGTYRHSDVIENLTAALMWSSKQTPQSFVAGQEAHAAAAYLSNWIELEQITFADSSVFAMRTEGAYDIQIVTFEPPGDHALVRITRKGVMIDGYDKRTLERVRPAVRIPDQIEIVKVVRDPSDGRWKPSQTIGRLIG